MSTEFFHSLRSGGLEIAKQAIRLAEPYQPLLATATILGKISWRLYQYEPLKKDVKCLSAKIRLLSQASRTPLSAERVEQIQERIKVLKNQKLEKERQLDLMKLTLGQLPSLFFSHPGANLYHSTHQIVSRGIQMHQIAHPLAGTDALKQAASLTFGLLSIAGTAASMTRMQGWVGQEEPVSQALVRTALGVAILEGAILANNTIQSLFKQRAQQIH